jgi:hypothetical protein
MPVGMHNKIKRDIKKAHPEYSEAKLESATNGTMAVIAKRSKHVGTFPGKGRARGRKAPSTRKRGKKK